MFSCERCGSRYSAKAASGHEYCPRCLARDGVAARLGFAPFGQPPTRGRVASQPPIDAPSKPPAPAEPPPKRPATAPAKPPVRSPAEQAVERVREAAQKLDA